MDMYKIKIGTDLTLYREKVLILWENEKKTALM